MRWPFASVEAAKFIGDPGLIKRAIKLAFGKIAKSNLELAIKWRENAVAQSKWVWTPERISELIALWNENLKIKEIGRRLGITEGAVKGKAQRLGLVRQNAVAQSKWVWTPERIAALIALWNESLSTSEIGRRLGITKNAVTGKVQRLGLVRRRRVVTAVKWSGFGMRRSK